MSRSPMIQVIDNGFIVNMNKPVGWTSFDVVRRVKHITGLRKIGHAGTLDPFASGVLLVCIGKATKKVNDLMNLPKEYDARIELGRSTDTLDPTGIITQEAPVPALSRELLAATLTEFMGKIKQKIPDYSAAKVGGTRYYSLARRGKEIPTRYKTVHIYDLHPADFGKTHIQITVKCSRGTYIRSLGYDIAQKLGTTGFISQLVRTRIGDYRIEEALSVEQFSSKWSEIEENKSIS